MSISHAIIAIEGVSFSGKSSVCQSARAWLNVVDEPVVYAKGRFVRAEGIEGATHNAMVTLEIEHQRRQDIVQLAAKGAVLLDRSVFSLLALVYAYAKRYNHPQLFADTFDSVIQGLRAEELVLPTHILLLEQDIATLRQRQLQRGTQFPDFWLSEQFVAAQYHVYKTVNEIYAQQGKALQSLDGINYNSATLPAVSVDMVFSALKQIITSFR